MPVCIQKKDNIPSHFGFTETGGVQALSCRHSKKKTKWKYYGFNLALFWLYFTTDDS